MRCTVDVWVGHTSHVLGVLGSYLIWRYGLVGYLGKGGRILLKYAVLLPFLLVLLLGCDEGVSLVGLKFQLAAAIHNHFRRAMLTFSILRVFLELLAGSKASWVTWTAAMVAV